MVKIALGDLVIADYMYEFNGFAFGSGTGIITETVEGILGLPAARSDDEDNQEDHGSWSGLDLLPGRTIQITLAIDSGPGDFVEDQLAAATSAFQVSKREQMAGTLHGFVTRRPGRNKRVSWAKARRSAFPSNYETARGLARGAIELYAPDPRFYSLDETDEQIVLAIGSAAGSVNATMAGDFKDGVEPIIEITGPVTNPRITNDADDARTIAIDGVVPAGDMLEIDVAQGRVTLWDGGVGTDHYEWVRPDNQWWSLIPGVNQISYNRAAGNVGASSTLTIRWRDGWTGAA